MTSRRTVPKDTPGLTNDGTSSLLASPLEKSNTSPAVPAYAPPLSPPSPHPASSEKLLANIQVFQRRDIQAAGLHRRHGRRSNRDLLSNCEHDIRRCVASPLVAELWLLYLGILYLREPGSSTWAGATAAVVANVVLIAYVIVAMKEDQSDRLAAEEDAKKAQ